MNSRKKFIAIIGRSTAGKSTIIRALTGTKGSKQPERIKDRSTMKWIGVISHSPQEQPIPFKQLRKEMRAAATDARSIGMVIALQPTHPTTRLSIEEVFEMVQSFAFERHVFVIARSYKGFRGIDPEVIQERLAKFDFEKPIQPLDARRFAHVNASVIRDIVGWF
jgi:energy-coupling factor transporter ATP-binding protein EcfA2